MEKVSEGIGLVFRRQTLSLAAGGFSEAILGRARENQIKSHELLKQKFTMFSKLVYCRFINLGQCA